MHPLDAEHDALVFEYLHSEPQVPVRELNWHRSGAAAQAVCVVRLAQGVVQVPETGFIWHDDALAH
jgi:hypothetical protein